jgi:hypothetical protein
VGNVIQHNESFSKWNGSIMLIEMSLTATEETTLLFGSNSPINFQNRESAPADPLSKKLL